MSKINPCSFYCVQQTNKDQGKEIGIQYKDGISFQKLGITLYAYEKDDRIIVIDPKTGCVADAAIGSIDDFQDDIHIPKIQELIRKRREDPKYAKLCRWFAKKIRLTSKK